MPLSPEKEIELLRRQIERLSKRYGQLQAEHEDNQRRRLRAEAVSQILTHLHEDADLHLPIGDWEQAVLRRIADMLRADRGALMRWVDNPSQPTGRVLVLAAGVGLPEGLAHVPSALLRGLAEAGLQGADVVAEWFDRASTLFVSPDACPLVVAFGADAQLPSNLHLSQEDASLVEPILRVFADLVDRRVTAEHLGRLSEAEAAERAKARFLANMSHELRTPMSGVVGVAQNLLEEGLEEHVEEAVRTIYGSGRRLLSLIDDILDVSRMDRGDLELNPCATPVHELLREVVDEFEVRSKELGLDLRLSWTEKQTDAICIDSVRFKQVLRRLIDNALKYTPQGTVELRGVLDETLVVEIVDSGMGMDPDTLRSVFRPFARAEEHMARSSQGAGLGLPISRRLVELMGGTLNAVSTPGLGSIFRIELPRTIPAASDSVVAHRALGTLRVLVAEDDRVTRAVTRRFLEKDGHRVSAVGDGREALQFLSGNEPCDLVLMDVQMPVMDGLEATRRVRRGEAGDSRRRVPIVALTAHVLPEHRQQCLEAGMDGHATKPIDPASFYSELARVLDASLRSPRGPNRVARVRVRR